jgi:hypothetical protein
VKRAEIDADQMPGQDSFLDVITNMVGILILLVLVVGLRTSRSVGSAPEVLRAQQARQDNELRQAYHSALATERNVRDMVRRVGNVRNESNFREEERSWLHTTLTQAEKEIEARRARLTNEDQRDFDMRRKLAEAQMTLDDLTRQQIALMSQEAPTEELECQPTPIARAVTGKELHVLLADDHVAIVPFEDLMEQMKEDAKANVWRLRQQDEMERTIGPVGGFRLRYCFTKENVVGRSDAGNYLSGSVSRFSHCAFMPVTTPAGEPAAEALQSNSEFFLHLRRLKPDGTTITIWTYPGNYDRLRELKRAIRELGFPIAVRPLPKGLPIGASRHGSESLSE